MTNERRDEREKSVDTQDLVEPQRKHGPALHDGVPEFEPLEDEDDLDDNFPEFPTTHELIMKDHLCSRSQPIWHEGRVCFV